MSEDEFAMQMALRKQQRALIGRGVRREMVTQSYHLEEDSLAKHKATRKRLNKLKSRATNRR